MISCRRRSIILKPTRNAISITSPIVASSARRRFRFVTASALARKTQRSGLSAETRDEAQQRKRDDGFARPAQGASNRRPAQSENHQPLSWVLSNCAARFGAAREGAKSR